MKILLKLAVATLMLAGVVQAAPKWITVSKADCIDNGGDMMINGVCRANWQNAGGICSAIGATLPTIVQLKGMITDCGGIVDKSESNENNSAYQSCYKERKFSASDVYWSSSTSDGITSYAWVVSFNGGNGYVYDKYSRYYVRCVQGG